MIRTYSALILVHPFLFLDDFSERESGGYFGPNAKTTRSRKAAEFVLEAFGVDVGGDDRDRGHRLRPHGQVGVDRGAVGIRSRQGANRQTENDAHSQTLRK